MRAEIQPMIDPIWREQAIARGVKIGDTGAPEEDVLFMLQGMRPTTNRQRAHRGRSSSGFAVYGAASALIRSIIALRRASETALA